MASEPEEETVSEDDVGRLPDSFADELAKVVPPPPPCEHHEAVPRDGAHGYHDCACGVVYWGHKDKVRHIVQPHLGEPHYLKCEYCGAQLNVVRQLDPSVPIEDAQARPSGHICNRKKCLDELARRRKDAQS